MSYDLSAPNPGPIPFPDDVDLSKVKRIHVLGVAGTGMGSFAGLLQKAGYQVTGSDENIYPPMSEKLPDWGIHAISGYKPENLDNVKPDFVIVGNVIRKVNPEATAVRERGIKHASFPAALGKLFMEQRRAVVVAGTHGKTTTTALLSHLLASAGRDPSFLVGGVPKNFPESFHLGKGSEFVVEGDEYDTAYFDKGPKFLHYRPKFVQFNGAEFDHADIYRDMDHYESSFTRLFALIPADGFLAACATYANTAKLIKACKAPVETYSARVDADVRAADIEMGPEGARFTIVRKRQQVGRFFLPMHGLHNVENATGATAIALRLGVTAAELEKGFASFAGVRRRQELVTTAGGIALVDDFAHHPTAVVETISAIAARYPGRKLWALFEPRSNTASRAIHQHEYEHAFNRADEVIFSTPKKIESLAAGEALNPAAIAEAISKAGKRARFFPSVDEILKTVIDEAKPGDVILTMSNGAFGGLVPKLKAALESRA